MTTPKTAPKRRFELVGFDDIKVAPGGQYLVSGLIPREGLIVVWGPPKCGKTFWTFDLVMHVALGWQYRGRRTATGTVVYIACEGERGLAGRVEAFRRERMAELFDRPPFYLLTTRLDLAADAVHLIDDIQAQLGADQPTAIVVDTLNRSLSGSESSDEDMGAYVKATDKLREAFECAVIVIHHCGLDDKRPRGHTSLAGAADAQIAVKKGDGDAVIATVEFMKDGPAGTEIGSVLRRVELDPDEAGEPTSSCVIDPAEGAAPRPKGKKINAAAKQALTLLNEAVLKGGTTSPPSEHIPEEVKGVTKALWRTYCENGGVINAEGNPREQLRRIIVTLKDAGLVGVWGDFVWPVTSRHKASQ